ncbi:MAG TPA: hypothetical protein VLY20_06260 [Nitrospiria bacterium]|nr:hypothetical protein [Nitrospiria bacterium]
MTTRSILFRHLGSSLIVILYTFIAGPAARAAEMGGESAHPAILLAQESGNSQSNSNILVELFLGPDRRSDLDAIKKGLEAVSITRIRTQFFRLGNPPENIAIGNHVPADVARLAIHLAVTYNRGVKYLLPQYRFFPDHIAIGTSAFDEKSQIPIQPKDLERLSDPSLTTQQFHALYRHLTGEDKQFPTYLK